MGVISGVFLRVVPMAATVFMTLFGAAPAPTPPAAQYLPAPPPEH